MQSELKLAILCYFIHTAQYNFEAIFKTHSLHFISNNLADTITSPIKYAILARYVIANVVQWHSLILLYMMINSQAKSLFGWNLHWLSVVIGAAEPHKDGVIVLTWIVVDPSLYHR